METIALAGMNFENTAESVALAACAAEALANNCQEVADGYLDVLVANFYVVEV